MVAGPPPLRPAVTSGPPTSAVAATTGPLVARTDNCELEELQLDKSLLVEIRYLKLPVLDVKLLRGGAAAVAAVGADVVAVVEDPPLPTLATDENLRRLSTAARAWDGCCSSL